MATVHNLVRDEIYEAKVFTTDSSNQIGINIFHYRIDAVSAPGVTDLDLALLVGATAVTIKAILRQNGRYEGVTIQRRWPLPPTLTQVDTTGNGAGTWGNVNAAPEQLAMVVTKQSAFAGRAMRGRVYLPFPPIDAIDTNATPTAAYVTAANAYVVGMTTPGVVTGGGQTANTTPVIFHRGSNTGTPISQVRFNKEFGTQRRRGIYGRPNTLPF